MVARIVKAAEFLGTRAARLAAAPVVAVADWALSTPVPPTLDDPRR